MVNELNERDKYIAFLQEAKKQDTTNDQQCQKTQGTQTEVTDRKKLEVRMY